MIQADEEQNEEVAQLHAAIKHRGPNQQYAVLQTPTKYQGIAFKLLIDWVLHIHLFQLHVYKNSNYLYILTPNLKSN